MNRKEFIKKGFLGAAAVSTCGFAIKKGNNYEGDCETTNDILGPFYRPNAPTRQDLTDEATSGHVIELKGVVYGADCTTPLKSALVEIWHCDTEGRYDRKSDNFRCRAKWLTDDDGKYSFKTILPGKYLNGELYRPAHIHFRVTAENSKELISQIYFKGDPHIEKDPWASKKEAVHRILPITLEDTKGNLTVGFDIYLNEKK